MALECPIWQPISVCHDLLFVESTPRPCLSTHSEESMSTEPVPIAFDEAAPATSSLPRSRNSTTPNRLAIILAFGSVWFVWGSTYLAIRYAVETIPPLYAAGARHLVAGSVLLFWCFLKGLRPTREQLRASIVIGFLFFLIGHGSLHWAEQRVPSGLAALLIATEPICVFLLGDLADRKWRMNAWIAAGVIVGLAGVGLLLERGVFSAPGMMAGAIALLIGSSSWAAGIVYSRRSQLSGHPLLLSALSLLAGSVMLLTVGTSVGEFRGFSLASVTPRSWASLAYLVVFGSIITFTAYNWLLEHYSPTLVATHTYINPIVAVFFGWLIAGEKVTLNVGIATAMVIGAVMLVERGTALFDRQ
jgi:drug/metabolite transporter (DMT)-like permease